MDNGNVVLMYCGILFSCIKKKEIVNLAGKWMEPESIELSEITQAQKDKGCMFSISCNP